MHRSRGPINILAVGTGCFEPRGPSGERQEVADNLDTPLRPSRDDLQVASDSIMSQASTQNDHATLPASVRFGQASANRGGHIAATDTVVNRNCV